MPARTGWKSSAYVFTVTSADITAPAVTIVQPANGASFTETTPSLAGGAGADVGDLPTITVKIWAGLDSVGHAGADADDHGVRQLVVNRG